MFLQQASAAWTVSQFCCLSPVVHPHNKKRSKDRSTSRFNGRRFLTGLFSSEIHWRALNCGSIGACMISSSDNEKSTIDFNLIDSATRSLKSGQFFVSRRFSDDLDFERSNTNISSDKKQVNEPVQIGPAFTSLQEDPLVDKLRTQLGVIHPIPSPPINRNIAGLFVFFFFIGVLFDKLWTSRKRSKQSLEPRRGIFPQLPTGFSLLSEKDLQRKETVEWVNMVLGKLWKVYRVGIENWISGLLQPVIDNLKKPDYVSRVEIKQFSLGEEPLSVRSVERRTSRRANDLQYQIGLRYTGGARMLLMLSLKFSVIPIMVPVGVRDFDIDGELWVKLRLVPTEPWVGAVSWAFVSLPKIKFELSPFRLFNLMAIPVLSKFLTKLLTEDLPRLFVRPKKIVLDFQKGKAVGPVSMDFKNGVIQEGNKDFTGELSVTLVDAQKLAYVFSGKTDPYVVLRLGDQKIRSKKNSQTTVIGPPGAPIWNQDFHFLVADPKKQMLFIQVRDSFGFTDYTIATGEVELGSLQDTVPIDRILVLQGGWGLFRKGSSGEILLRLTYKAYVEDEDDDGVKVESMDSDASDDEILYPEVEDGSFAPMKKDLDDGMENESFMDVLAALIVSEEFQGIVSSEAGKAKSSDEATKSDKSIPKSPNSNSETVPTEPESSSNGSEGSAIVWLAAITSVAVLIALSVDGSNIFNP